MRKRKLKERKGHQVARNGHQVAPAAGLTKVVRKNIATIVTMRLAEEKKKTAAEHLADRLTQFSGSLAFVYVHVVWFTAWIVANLGWLGTKPFDPFPFSLLTLIVSLEAIFLSTFVLISQNRASLVADRRADLDLQINLLSEHEVTRVLALLDAIADHIGVKIEEKHEIEDLKKEVGPKQVLEGIELHEKQAKPENAK